MALIVTNHSVIINLSAVYRDLAWDAATVRDNLEHRVISANHAKAKQYRSSTLYGESSTQSDGYLLVYNFSSKEDKLAFEAKAVELGLEMGSHIASSYCVWFKSIVIAANKRDDVVYLEAVQHVDDSKPMLNLSARENDYFEDLVVTSAVTKTCQISKAYIEYTNRNTFWMIVTTLMSLFKTKGSHINYYTPYKYEFTETPLTDLRIGKQCLPGVATVVPNIEHESAKGLDSEPSYFQMFSSLDQKV